MTALHPVEIGSIDDVGTYLAIEPHAGRALLTAASGTTGDVAMIALTPAQARQAIQALAAIAAQGDTADLITEGTRA